MTNKTNEFRENQVTMTAPVGFNGLGLDAIPNIPGVISSANDAGGPALGAAQPGMAISMAPAPPAPVPVDNSEVAARANIAADTLTGGMSGVQCKPMGDVNYFCNSVGSIGMELMSVFGQKDDMKAPAPQMQMPQQKMAFGL